MAVFAARSSSFLLILAWWGMRKMTNEILAALLLNFGAAASAMVARQPAWDHSMATRSIGFLLFPLGAVAGFAAIALFVYFMGLEGLVAWVLSAIASVFVAGIVCRMAVSYTHLTLPTTPYV